MLEAKSVYFQYDQSFSLDNISFKLDQGEILGVIGSSGCGKTTLLKLIFGELEPSKGRLNWRGHKIPGPSDQLVKGHKDIKYVTQEAELMPYTSVLDNIIKPLSRQHMAKNLTRANKLLDVVELLEVKDKKVKDLSGGQKQRVALAQSMARTPRLLLLDEPFAHIDKTLQNKLRIKMFNFLKQENITAVVATHDKADILPFATKVIVLQHGKFIAMKPPKELYDSPENQYTAGLLEDYNYIPSGMIFPKRIAKENLIIYPQDISIFENNKGQVEIINQYFMGNYYKLILKWSDQNLIVHTPSALDQNHRYSIRFDEESILKRNNI